MSSYGTTFGQMAAHAKDVVRHAFHGEAYAGEDEHGDVWDKATLEGCEEAVLDEIDNLYYHLEHMAACARAYERICGERGWRFGLAEYAEAEEAELRRFAGEYVYEQDMREAVGE